MANQMNVQLIGGMNHQFTWNNCLELVFACQKCAHLAGCVKKNNKTTL